MLNERLGKYLLLEKIPGKGPAETFLAKSSVADGLNKFFIIKRQVRTSTAKIEIPSLSHSNILAVFDSGIDRGYFFSVMDYFESFSLAQILADFAPARCQLGIDQCLYIVRETAAALNYAHNFTAHGKISTDSILIGLDGAVKIMDFEYFADSETESKADLQTLSRLLRQLLGDNYRATLDLEELSTKSFASAGELYREVNRYLNSNYPEFSSPDFGEQLKKFYSSGVEHLHAKLREYANIDIKKVPLIVPDIYELPEKSAVTHTQTMTYTTSSLPEGFGKVPKKGTSPEVSFEQISRENPFIPAPVIQKRPPPRILTPIVTGESEEQKPSLVNDIMLLSAVGILLTLICYTYNITIKNYSNRMIETVHMDAFSEKNVQNKNEGTENYSAGVYSRMDASRQLAYVNITVMGATPDARLFINGKELLEKPPLVKYAIFAKQHTLITVLSAKTRRTDARRIMLKPGEVFDVTLSLRPPRH